MTSARQIRLVLLTIFLLAAAHAQTRKTPAVRDGFCVHGGGINFPIDRFLLIRKGDQYGAIKITRITPDAQTKPRVDEWLGTVDYESYSTTGANALFAPSDKRTGELVFGRIKGFGFHYSWQSGNLKAHVGPWSFVFFGPDGMFMTSSDFWNGVNHDSGLQFAPTSAKTVEQLDPKDSRLHWYNYDNNSNFSCPVPTPPTKNPTQGSLN